MITIQPLHWSALPELHDVPELDASDEACMAAIRDVLARHGKLERFGLHLIHRHFELEDGEILVERPDAATRTQHVSVERAAAVPEARATTWIFGGEGATVHCACMPHPGQRTGCWMHQMNNPPREIEGPPEPSRPSGPSWRPRQPKRDERER